MVLIEECDDALLAPTLDSRIHAIVEDPPKAPPPSRASSPGPSVAALLNAATGILETQRIRTAEGAFAASGEVLSAGRAKRLRGNAMVTEETDDDLRMADNSPTTTTTTAAGSVYDNYSLFGHQQQVRSDVTHPPSTAADYSRLLDAFLSSFVQSLTSETPHALQELFHPTDSCTTVHGQQTSGAFNSASLLHSLTATLQSSQPLQLLLCDLQPMPCTPTTISAPTWMLLLLFSPSASATVIVQAPAPDILLITNLMWR